jgi:hypothetical protein
MIMKLLATYTVYYYKVQTNNRQFLERNLLSNNSFSLYQTPNKMTQKKSWFPNSYHSNRLIYQ